MVNLKPRIRSYSLIVALLFMTVFFWAGFAHENRKFQSEDPAHAADCTPDANLVNPCRPWLSAFSNYHISNSGGGFKAEILHHEQRIGRQLDVVHGYHGPGSFALSADDKYFINRPNTYLYTTFKPSTKWADAGGGNATTNANIDKMAMSVKSVAPKKIMLGVFHEPENDVSPGTANCQGLKGSAGSPAQYRAMWANTRKRFDALGVTNVVWVVNYMGTPKWNCMYKDLWPGNNLVDWVMWDPYNFGSETLKWNDRTDDFYGWMTANSDATHNYISKPWGLAEWGTSETTQKTAYRWYDEAKASLEAGNFPNLKLYSIFDSGDVNSTSDQRIDRDTNHVMDPVEQQHYNAFANSRIFSNSTPTTPTADTTAPTATITGPAHGAVLSNQITISATASDNRGVAKVEFTIDGSIIATDATAPYSMVWDTGLVSNGDHIIRVKAYDAAGNTKTAQITVKVNNSTSSPLTPSIHVFSASPNIVTMGGKTTLVWTTSNTTSCSISPNGPQNSTATNWLTPAYTSSGLKKYVLTCKNAAGQTTSAELTVTVTAPVAPPAKPTLTTDKDTTAQGAGVLLSWSSVGASQCVLNPGNVIATGSSASKLITNIRQTVTYTVECSNSAGKATSDAITIRVIVSGQTVPVTAPAIISFTAEPTSLPGPGMSTLKWATSNIATNGCNVSPSVLTSTSASGQWTTPQLTQSTTFTLTCKDYAGKIVNKSVSVVIGNQPAAVAGSTAPHTLSSGAEPELTVFKGKSIINVQMRDKVARGQYASLDPGNIVDEEKIQSIVRVEYYDGEVLLQAVYAPPYALDTKDMPLGVYTVTERVYYHDGSQSERTQNITIISAVEVAARGPSPVQKILIGVGIGVGAVVVALFLTMKWWIPHLRTHWVWLDQYLAAHGHDGGQGPGPTYPPTTGPPSSPTGGSWPNYPY